MSRKLTDYEAFETSSVSNRRLLRQEELILEVTEILSQTLEKEGITKKELADRLGKTKGFVSQVLAGGRNLTLRTVADIADALECRIRIDCEQLQQKKEETMVSLNANGRKFARWNWSDQPVILKVVSTENTELSEEMFGSLLRTAA